MKNKTKQKIQKIADETNVALDNVLEDVVGNHSVTNARKRIFVAGAVSGIIAAILFFIVFLS